MDQARLGTAPHQPPARAPGTGLAPHLGRVAAALAFTAGAILVLAAVGKAITWHTSGQATIGPWAAPRWLAAGLAFWEAGLGLALCLGIASRTARLAGAVTYGGFALLATWWASTGTASCGCFGAVAMPPLIMAPLDALLAGALIVMARSQGQGSGGARAAAGGRRLALAGGIAVLVAAWGATGPPAVRVGAHLPAALALPAACTQGTWVLCFYRSTCARCRHDLPLWLAQARFDAALLHPRTWAFIAVDGGDGGDDADDPFPPDSPFMHLAIRDRAQPTPWFARLEGGVLTIASGQPPAPFGSARPPL